MTLFMSRIASRWLAVSELVVVDDDDDGIFGRQWINNTERIFVR